MKITHIKIKNYRNLDGVEIFFHPDINFIVGENNLGKSNLLKLLNILFYKNNFNEDDFYDNSKPIEIHLSLYLAEVEKGIFDDFFDPHDSTCLNLVAVQETVDEKLEFKHRESSTSISSSRLKTVNYIEYDSLRNPSSELKFDKSKGAGRFLNHIILNYLGSQQIQDLDFIDRDKLDAMLLFVTQNLQKIKPFNDFSIKAILEDNQENLLAKLILLANDKGQRLEQLSYGVQFLTLIPLSLLEKLLYLSSRPSFNRSIIEDESTLEKLIPILIGLDEPEIHLHPYAQRALVKYLNKVISNNDVGFTDLLRSLFSIDKLIGQILIVSHSPSILLDDYRQIIRFYLNSNDSQLSVKSGSTISLDTRTEKQLLRNLPYVKEAFFSKTIILVEGDSELGAFPVFAERMELDLDELGISIIEAGGSESVVPLMDLFKQFGIPSVGVIDSDKKSLYEPRNIDNLFFTQGQDFEEDLYANFELIDYVKYMELEYPSKIRFLIGKARNIGIEVEPQSQLCPQFNAIPQEEIENLKAEAKEEILKSLKTQKTVIKGRELGHYVTLIPQVYQDVINKAVELSNHVN